MYDKHVLKAVPSHLNDATNFSNNLELFEINLIYLL